jgi:hypothetical protein
MSMEYNLEQHRAFFTPIVYECMEQLLQQIQHHQDYTTFEVWKELIELLQQKEISITYSFNVFMNKINMKPFYEEYWISIYTMFIKYENNVIVGNK